MLCCGALAAEQEIEVAVGEWPPYISETQEHNGVVSHIITDIFASMGVKAKISFFPWARAYLESSKGKFNATGVWMYKYERAKEFLYSEPVLTERFVFFHKKSLDFDWQTLEDLRRFTMGGGVKYSYGEEFDAALESGTLVMERVSSVRQNFLRLLFDRIEVFPEEINVGYATLRDHFEKDDRELITHHPRQLLDNQSYVLFPKSLPDSKNLVKRFNRELREIRENGAYDKYMENLKAGLYDKS